ncbi:MAG TPA: AMP-binding protein, partial [Bryobacteraceae bacterium]|nr:AMP-binding protein [Bryobacteraceae bacterium]
TPNDKRIVAYIVAAVSDGSVIIDALRQHVSATLPAYMVPNAWVTLDALPLSRNGKVDRKALPAPDNPHADAFVAPRTLVEEMLATIWCQIFNLGRVGVNESFFSLGGHSLLAMQVVSRARKAFGVDLSLSALFQFPTIAGLAGVIADLQGKGSEYNDTVNALPVITPDPENRFEPFPLTEVQQAYWLGRNEMFEFGNVTTHSYDEMETLRLDAARFEQIWNRLIERHDMLRAVVRPDGMQQVLPTVPHYPIRVTDLRGRSLEDVNAALSGVRAEMSHQMLDVHTWPVFDIRVTLLNEERARIHFSTDALVFDVWSFVTLVQELVTLYLDPAAELPQLEMTFRDYVLAEQALHKTERYTRALDYWERRVPRLAPAPELPMAASPSSLKAPRFTRLHARLEPEAWSRLKLRCSTTGLTGTGIMLAAYAEVLAQYSRNPQFSLNLTFLNRHPMHPQVNQVVGEFTSLTMLGVDNSGQRTFLERARQIQADLWNDLEHNDVSGIHVLRALTRSQGRAPSAQMPVGCTSALVVPVPDYNPAFPIEMVDGVTQTSQVWLDCGVWEADHALLCNWDVVLDVYPQGLLQEVFAAYWTLVRRLADEDEIWNEPVIDLLPTATRELVKVANETQAPVSDETLLSLFTRQLQETPEAPAVITTGRQVSYRELGAHAAFVQSRLLEHGVGKNQLVAIVMDKGWEQIAAALGIVAAGAAYLPIDPVLPEQRIRYLLEHGQVSHVFTQPWLEDSIAALTSAAVHVIDEHSAHASGDLLESPARPDDVAYVIFTSGSTGLPKGVMIDHRGAVNTIVDVNRRCSVGASDRVLAVSALNFDLSVYDVFGLLAAGGAIVVPDHDRRLDPTHWLSLVESTGVSVWNSVPALMKLFVDHTAYTGAALPRLR